MQTSTVHPGDTLGKIAARFYGSAGKYPLGRGARVTTWRAAWTIALLLGVAMLAVACAGWRGVDASRTPGAAAIASPSPVVSPSPIAAPPAAAAARPTPITGWAPEYDAHVQAEVAKAPALLALSGARMSSFCPNWDAMDAAARSRFFADLMYAVAGPESGRDRRVMFNETGIIDRQTGGQTIDSVTGRPIISEGLLQLSYADMQSYPACDGLACAFDWTRDRADFDADLAANAGKKSFKSAHPERSILDPYVQLSCGVHILHRLVARDPSRPFLTAAGKYWSTMRPQAPAYREVIANLRERRSACF